MRELNPQYAKTLSGDSFYFENLSLCIFYDIWHKTYMVIVRRQGIPYITDDTKIASFSFTDMKEAIEIFHYILTKIALAEALFGWLL